MSKIAPEPDDPHGHGHGRPTVKVHASVHKDLDSHHEKALEMKLKECSDEALLAEIARRGIDIKHSVTEDSVKETYKFERVLGEGASGQVHLVRHKKSGQLFACKVIVKDGGMNDADSMNTEIEIMKHVRHKHVVGLYELFESNVCMWLILELVQGGDLNFFISKTEHYSEAVVAHLFEQALKGVHYLHSRGVVHRDLKLDNILLHGKVTDGEVKIADFGLSALVKVGSAGYDRSESSKRKEYKGLKEMWGTATYFAPELIQGGGYGPQADVWSLGCILFEMLSGRHPFPSCENDDELFEKIKKADYDISSGPWAHISAEAKTLVQGLLTVDPAQRLSCTEALRHPWFTSSTKPNTHLSDAHTNIKDKVGVKTTAAHDQAPVAAAAAADGHGGGGADAELDAVQTELKPAKTPQRRGLMSFLSHPGFHLTTTQE